MSMSLLTTSRRIDELRPDAQPLSRSSDASLQNIPYAQLAAYLPWITGLTFVRER
jgi:hypothetical protein